MDEEKYSKKFWTNPLYGCYRAMKERCSNANSISFKNYGGKGIKVCKKWLKSFDAFYAWAISNGYEEGLTIDRINSNKGYDPSNCRWLSRAEQNYIPNKTSVTKANKTGFRGVNFCNTRNKFKASIRSNNKYTHIGYYDNLEEAANARMNKEIEIFGKIITNLKKVNLNGLFRV